ncbi:MAG TPA: ABC transporter ATP-binding protein [Candidatus Saccharimonadales bacterium]|nr:ABC transporter ATP-binding protein [Candidatus Saccharimonadales bacterium]
MAKQLPRISVQHLSKEFKLPHERHSSLKSTILNFGQKKTYERFRALDDISFQVEEGEFFGIVGRNGSGKSTLLKLLANIYTPSGGKVNVNGRLTPFIELGVGFNPELTGRENIFLNGAILGLTQKEIESKYDEIVAFSELDRFMDQKLKNYSSGMQVRLAFSIAIQAHNDILLIDEVLAVGDANFQRKCYKVFKDIKKSGKTVVFVTHDMGAVQDFCDRALMIEDSKVIMIGKPREVALRYEMANLPGRSAGGNEPGSDRPENPAVKIDNVYVVGKNNKLQTVSQEDSFEISIDYTVNVPTEIQFNLFLTNQEGRYLCGINTTVALENFKPEKGSHTLTCHFDGGQLNKGEYTAAAAIYTYCKWPSNQKPELIDVFDVTYGENLPRIKVLDEPT